MRTRADAAHRATHSRTGCPISPAAAPHEARRVNYHAATRGQARDTAAGRTPMAVKHQLEGRRIAVLAADGFEKVELTVPVTALRAAGAHVDIISLRPGRI